MADYLTCGACNGKVTAVAVGTNDPIGVTRQDRIRERELFRFYRPEDGSASDCEGQSPASPSSNTFDCEDSSPITNNDVTLAALAQVVALRLGVHRAMINVIGRQTQYTLVESTKTLDLVNQITADAEGDGAWIGSGGKIDKSISMCETVIALPTDVYQHPFLIVPDLSKDARFKNRPYVAGFPHYRFYAGTPLRTARGVVIGALCVFAHTPRTLSNTEKEYMATISETIMQHLEMRRAAAERDKVTRMSRGLNAFVEGKMSQFTSTFDPRNAREAMLRPGFTSSSSMQSNLDANGQPSGMDAATTPTAETLTEFPQTPTQEVPAPSSSHGSATTVQGSSGETSKTAIEEQFQATLLRAAGLLGEALGLKASGGVVFYDTVARIDVPPSDASGPNSPTDGHEADDLGNFSDGAITPGIAITEEATASVLGTSVSASYEASNPDESYRNFKSRMLSKLMRRYSSGRTWEFDEHGAVPSHDEGFTRLDATSRQHAAERDVRQRSEAEHLMSVFPGVRSLVFVPLWDANLSRHYAGCFAWTTDATTRFSADVELSFVTAFGNSVSAEISRLATIDADQRKSDFIGSVSHELRSPLHGVLASAEFLAETQLDSFQSTLVNTIDSCGRTLLDTINHVLDFSKINSLRRTWRKTQKSSRSHLHSGSQDLRAAQSSGIMSILGSTDVAAITEEVVDSIYAGKIYAKAFSPADITDMNAAGLHRRDSEQPKWQDSANSGVQVLLDIAPGDYRFVTQPGAIRRIIMNIFGNALKYTEKGSIIVRLWQQADPDSPGGNYRVILTVRDTGKGISSGYLRTRLYTPFAQENDLAPGTGLGLSIVRNIVTMLRGDINIRSKVGRGTEVQISLQNLKRPAETQGSGEKEVLRSTSLDFSYLQSRRDHLTIGLYGFRPSRDGSPQDLERILRRYVQDWCDVKTPTELRHGVRADVVVVDETLLHQLEHSGLVGSNDNVIVLCSNPAPMQVPKGTTSRHYFLLKPFGPYKLARTIRKCLERNRPSMKRRYSSGAETNSVTSGLDVNSTTKQGDSGNEMAIIEDSDTKPFGEMMPPAPRHPSMATIQEISPRGSVAGNTPTAAMDGIETTGVSKKQIDLPPLQSKQVQKPVTERHQSPRILVVDDNKTNLMLLQTFLRKRGYPVDSAVDGGMAVEQATENQYDIIFMDISMPVMNGFEATREIRRHEENTRKQWKRESSGLPRSRPSSKIWQHGSVTMTPAPSDQQHASAGGSADDALTNMPAVPTKPATPPGSPDDETARNGGGGGMFKSMRPALIIALTGLASGRDQSEAFTSGVDLYMTKPVSFKKVGKIIDIWTANGGYVPPETEV